MDAPLLRPRRRRQGAVPALVLGLCLGVVALGAARARERGVVSEATEIGGGGGAAEKGRGGKRHHGHRVETDDDDDAYDAMPPDVALIEVPMSAFLAFEAVIQWLKDERVDQSVITAALDDANNASRGAATSAKAGALLAYLPARLTIEMDAKAVAGELGDAASGGYFAFSLFYADTAAWNVVMDARGQLLTVAPVRSVDATGAAHFCALKNYDEDALLVATTVNYTGAGAPYVWDWRRDAYTRLGAHDLIVGAHDIQWAYGATAGSTPDEFWTPGPTVKWGCTVNMNLTKVDAATGGVTHNLRLPGGACSIDVNHAQLLDEDRSAFLSLRAVSSLAWYDLDSANPDGGAQRWLIGGDDGEWAVVDSLRGRSYPAGTTVWAYQHNAEYIGDDEVAMYDNLGLGNESRCLIISLNATAKTATLVWEHKMGALSLVFGDCDPLPSGNMLSSYWAAEYGDATPTGQAQAGVVEVSRATNEVAWHMRVYGAACPDATCHNSEHPGWKMYSIERFYDAPLLAAARKGVNQPPHCTVDGGTLKFSTWNTYKQQNYYGGAYALTEVSSGHVAAQGSFSFAPHWRATLVTDAAVSLTGETPAKVELVVTNQRGRNVSYTFDCGE